MLHLGLKKIIKYYYYKKLCIIPEGFLFVHTGTNRLAAAFSKAFIITCIDQSFRHGRLWVT